MCSPKPWTEILPSVLLGLRTSFKEDIQATPAKMLYGTCLRISGEFFLTTEMPPEPQIFVEKFCEHMRGIRPRPTAHHNKARIFILKDLTTFSHVFIRCDHVKAPYIGPYPVIQRISDVVYKINVDGTEKQRFNRTIQTSFHKQKRWHSSRRTGNRSSSRTNATASWEFSNRQAETHIHSQSYIQTSHRN